MHETPPEHTQIQADDTITDALNRYDVVLVKYAADTPAADQQKSLTCSVRVHGNQTNMDDVSDAASVLILGKDTKGTKAWAEETRKDLEKKHGHVDAYVTQTGRPVSNVLPEKSKFLAAFIELEQSEPRVQALESLPAKKGDGEASHLWLWADSTADLELIPAHEVTLISGGSSKGKSTLVCALMAKLSRGELPGAYEGQPMTSLYLQTERSWKNKVAWDLDAAGADTTRVRALAEPEQRHSPTPLTDLVLQQHREHLGSDTEKSPRLWQPDLTHDADLSLLAETIRQLRPALVVIDPITSFLGSADTNSLRDIRQVMQKLYNLAAQLQTTIVVVHHDSKGDHVEGGHNSSGSTAFRDVAASALLVDRETVEGVDGDTIVTVSKNALGRPGKSVRAAFEVQNFARADGRKLTPSEAQQADSLAVAFFAAFEPTELSTAQVRAARARAFAVERTPPTTTKAQQATQFVRGLLSTGPKSTSEVIAQVRQHNPQTSESTVRRALEVAEDITAEKRPGEREDLWSMKQPNRPHEAAHEPEPPHPKAPANNTPQRRPRSNDYAPPHGNRQLAVSS